MKSPFVCKTKFFYMPWMQKKKNNFWVYAYMQRKYISPTNGKPAFVFWLEIKPSAALILQILEKWQPIKLHTNIHVFIYVYVLPAPTKTPTNIHSAFLKNIANLRSALIQTTNFVHELFCSRLAMLSRCKRYVTKIYYMHSFVWPKTTRFSKWD